MRRNWPCNSKPTGSKLSLITYRSGSKSGYSKRPMRAGCQSCSRVRPAAARRDSLNTWLGELERPLITVAAHEDMTAADLAGRFLLAPEGTVWHDGPMTLAVRYGAICYLDEIVEARQDTTVVIHPLTDARRMLPLEKKNELVAAHPDFQLVISYNPGYQSAVKDLKESTKQRFIGIDFDYPKPDVEAEIVSRESGADRNTARRLVDIALRSRNLRGRGLEEGASTRMLIHAGRLVAAGVELEEASQASIVLPITDDLDMREALTAAVAACL